ncbi:uncharacterized protein EDB91DRAFT_1063606 [Suillus paluster]|uniref:uncharacterized protein n=1 Tax=Suillus paluster TaxID=48578 RepID=UPI001B86664A|nr:uncharacterized protein EDB91DRAFT_1063606 [Suillus paluster]KAG1723129.1 hypothetical protein EDB91DRAFT_1063606 [Suillus paluster]
MVNSSEHGLARVVHHKDYYLRGGDMTVLVENHLYRIHSHFFERESLFFRQKFQSAEGEERGSSDNNAYTLDDVKSEDFARFLWVFYNPKYSLYEAPLETWLSILHLANRWSFCNVKELTVRELEKIQIEPVEKIAIYHEYTINKLFLVPSYIAICKRDKPLSFAEGMQLGMETVLRIADARERARQRAAESGIRTPTFDDFEDNELETMIREVFGIASRPTSPTPQTSNSTSYTNGSTYTSSTKVNGTAPPKVNGGPSIRTNGTSIPDPTTRSSTRTNGPSIPDPTARSSVDTMRTFATAMESRPTSSSSSASAHASSSPDVEPKPADPTSDTKPTPPEKPNATVPEHVSSPFTTTPSTADPLKTGSWNRPNGTGEPSSVASPVLILF